MYTGRVACCVLLNYVEYAPLTVFGLEIRWDRRTDGRQTVTLRLPLNAASIIKMAILHYSVVGCGGNE